MSKSFTVIVESSDGLGKQELLKTLILNVDQDLNDPKLMENERISNPTNRKARLSSSELEVFERKKYNLRQRKPT